MEFVGIDVAKKKFDLVWLKDGKKRTKVFANSPDGHDGLLKWLSEHGLGVENTHLAMEATGQYYEAVGFALVDAGYTVSVINPVQIKAFGEAVMSRQKTDRADAELIARFCAANNPRPWEAPSMATRELQRLVARLEALQGMHVQEQNRMHESAGAAKESVERVMQTLSDEIERLEKQIQDHIDDNPDLKDQDELLRSIPGVGPRVASYFLAWLRTDRFDDVRQAAAFVGLTPRHRESGSSVRGKASLSKLGHGRLRKVLYMPAMSAIRCNAAAKTLRDRLVATGKNKKVAIVAVMRKLVHWMMGVLKSGKRFDVQLALAKV